MDSAQAAMPERTASVLRVADEAPGIMTLRLSVPPDFSFQPGMWVMLQFPDRAEKANAYSISTSPFEKGYIELSFANVGPLTRRLAGLRAGDSLLLRGPYGKWFYTDDVRDAVLISDGTGIAPYRAMARYALEKRLPNKLTIICSARTPDAFIYARDLELFAKAGIKIFRTITHPELMTSGQAWDGPRGAIEISTLEREVGALLDAHYYLCGPRRLIEVLTDGLQSRGVASASIHYEKWGDYTWL